MTLNRIGPIVSLETFLNDFHQACRQIRNAPVFAGR